jgi:transposase
MKGYGPLMDQPGPSPKVMLADKGYDSDAIRQDLKDRGVEPIIPFKRNRKVQEPIDGFLYALRNMVERCFNKLKQSRRLATRYDKTASSFLGFVLIAYCLLLIAYCFNKVVD